MKNPIKYRLTPFGLVVSTDSKGLVSAVSHCQSFSDEFNEFEQCVTVDVDSLRCYQDGPARDVTGIVGPEGTSTEELGAFAAAENDRITGEIIGGFPEIEIPADFEVSVGSVERGKYPQSRFIEVTLNWRSEPFRWDSRGVGDDWIPLKRAAEFIRSVVVKEVKLLTDAERTATKLLSMIHDFEAKNGTKPSVIPICSFETGDDYEEVLSGDKLWSFEENKAASEHVRARLEAADLNVAMVPIRPDQYFSWLKLTGLENSQAIRARYIGEVAMKESQ